jgi:hypothetical protein
LRKIFRRKYLKNHNIGPWCGLHRHPIQKTVKVWALLPISFNAFTYNRITGDGYLPSEKLRNHDEKHQNLMMLPSSSDEDVD